MSEDIKVSIAKGKYTVVIPDIGGLHALRYEEPWLSENDLCGNNLVYNLAYELHESRNEVEKQRERVEKLEASLKYMVDNVGQPRALETRDGFVKAEKLVESINGIVDVNDPDELKARWEYHKEAIVEMLKLKDGEGHYLFRSPVFDIGFIGEFKKLSKDVHDNATDKGWWDGERNDGELLMLVVTELSEACEALRHGNTPDDHIPEFNGAEAELADAMIRIMDLAEARDWRVAEAIIAKNKYNKTRPHKHGGKKF